ncbi:MAG: hypothetical protein EPN88_06870 [Bacteroidetes bacterium]|nr:MAG: hypothetical protein EPN88_06870 [Bacteroidota bacterium]
MNIKKFLAGAATSAVMFAAMAIPAFAAPSVHTNFGQQVNAAQCNTTGAPILNVTFKVINDADSGTTRPVWAFDSFNRRLQVWEQTDGTFCAIAKYQGQFVTIAGDSPGAAYDIGGTVGDGVKGTVEGGYTANFDGTFTPTLPTKGNLGTYNYACDTLGNCPGAFDWISAYFTGNTTFNQPYWAWNYHAGNNGSWVNASTGNSGDITGN